VAILFSSRPFKSNARIFSAGVTPHALIDGWFAPPEGSSMMRTNPPQEPAMAEPVKLEIFTDYV